MAVTVCVHSNLTFALPVTAPYNIIQAACKVSKVPVVLFRRGRKALFVGLRVDVQYTVYSRDCYGTCVSRKLGDLGDKDDDRMRPDDAAMSRAIWRGVRWCGVRCWCVVVLVPRRARQPVVAWPWAMPMAWLPRVTLSLSK